MNNIDQLETDLWAAADNLRANSKLTSSEYCMPVLGIIFLRHATSRYDDAVRQIETDRAAGAMPNGRWSGGPGWPAVPKGTLQAGKVKPMIDRRFLLTEVPATIRHVEDGHARGKVVITVCADSTRT